MQRHVRRSILLAICIILFVYFEIHSCSRDEITAPPQPPFENMICAATNVFFLDDSFGCVTGNLGTFMITKDGGRTWAGSTIEAGTLYGAQFVDCDTGWIVGKDGAIFNTNDGGSTWTKIVSSGYPFDEDFYKVDFMDRTLGYVLGYLGVYRTVDGGSDWTNNWLPVAPSRGAWDMSFVDDSTGFLLGSKYSDPDPIILYRTVDAGASWAPVPGSKGSLLRTVLTIAFASERTGWAGGGVIMKTTDGGATWQTQLSAATVRKFCFFSEQYGFAVGGKSILRTADGGATWQNVTPVDARIADLRGISFVDRNHGWVVGRAPDEPADGRLYKHTILLSTHDGGTTWTLRDFPFDSGGVDELSGTIE
jgi:photosystem II stability/assembly factor-like uncharacterized protein